MAFFDNLIPYINLFVVLLIYYNHSNFLNIKQALCPPNPKLLLKTNCKAFFLPIIGIIIGITFREKNECFSRSMKRGSALSTIILVLVASILLYYFAFKQK